MASPFQPTTRFVFSIGDSEYFLKLSYWKGSRGSVPCVFTCDCYRITRLYFRLNPQKVGVLNFHDFARSIFSLSRCKTIIARNLISTFMILSEENLFRYPLDLLQQYRSCLSKQNRTKLFPFCSPRTSSLLLTHLKSL